MGLQVIQDGLTYVIDLTEPLGCRGVGLLLRQDPDGWLLQNDTGSFSKRIGRRKNWQKALHDALVIAQEELDKLS